MSDDVITAEGAALERARGRVEFALRRASEGSPDLETLDDIARALTSALGYMTIAQPCTVPHDESRTHLTNPKTSGASA
jgi:hypothetical protein